MENKKENVNNWFPILIAFILGLRIIKHVDFKNLTLKNPILDTLYIIAFVTCMVMLFKNFKKKK